MVVLPPLPSPLSKFQKRVFTCACILAICGQNHAHCQRCTSTDIDGCSCEQTPSHRAVLRAAQHRKSVHSSCSPQHTLSASTSNTGSSHVP